MSDWGAITVFMIGFWLGLVMGMVFSLRFLA